MGDGFEWLDEHKPEVVEAWSRLRAAEDRHSREMMRVVTRGQRRIDAARAALDRVLDRAGWAASVTKPGQPTRHKYRTRQGGEG